MSKRLVNEFFNIEDFEIKKLSETQETYWLKVRDFWWQVKDTDVNSITSGQASWLSKIEADLEDNWRPRWMETEGVEIFA